MNEITQIKHQFGQNHLNITAINQKTGKVINLRRGPEAFDKINELLQMYRALVANRSFSPENDKGTLRLMERLGLILYSLFFEGLEEFLDENRYLLIDQQRYILPMELAYNGEQFLGLSHAIGNWTGSWPSQTDTKIMREPPDRSSSEGSLIIGEDGKSVSRILKNLTKVILSPDSSTLLKELSTKPYDVIHFSGHGHFDSNNPSNSYLFTGATSGDLQSHAGNHLTLSQLSKVDLLRTNLVVLSACQSGIVTNDYQGLIGFADKFLQLGAKSCITTIWSIQDQSASRFATYLYASLTQGHSVGESLRVARMRCWIDDRDMLTGLAYVLYGSPKIKIVESDSDKKVTGLPSDSTSLQKNNLNRFFMLLQESFSYNELSDLCFTLNVDFEGLPHRSKRDFARELVTYCERRGNLQQLVDTCIQHRPNVLWSQEQSKK